MPISTDKKLGICMRTQEEIDEISKRQLCSECIGEKFLSNEVGTSGKRRKCSYCNKFGKCYNVVALAERVETAFEQHYSRTSTEPDTFEEMLLRDPDSTYEWSRKGEPVVYAIMDAANIPEEAANDIQVILEEKHSVPDSEYVGEEAEFDTESHYEEKSADDEHWQEEWNEFEKVIKTEARFFSRSAVEHLASVFGHLDHLKTRDGSPPIVVAGPNTTWEAVYRARAFQSEEALLEAMKRPDLYLGTPPASKARAGRMNAHGIAVFYGANEARAAVSEVRPPVGSSVLVGRFHIIRQLRLLDLAALSSITESGSIFDPTYSCRLERARFLRNLEGWITRPVMPDDETTEYLATQAIADFLATNNVPTVDGIIFNSVQAGGAGTNVVLFHGAAKVEKLDLPSGSKVSAHTGFMTEDGWEEEYDVFEEVPKNDFTPPTLRFGSFGATKTRPTTLRVDVESLTVHDILAVQFTTREIKVRRHRTEGGRSKMTVHQDWDSL
jgi:hypothetical protein